MTEESGLGSGVSGLGQGAMIQPRNAAVRPSGLMAAGVLICLFAAFVFAGDPPYAMTRSAANATSASSPRPQTRDPRPGSARHPKGTLSARQNAPAARPNILLVTLDTTRQDALGCYRDPAKT